MDFVIWTGKRDKTIRKKAGVFRMFSGERLLLCKKNFAIMAEFCCVL